MMRANRIKLALFTWTYLNPQTQQIPVPVCPDHPEAGIHIKISGGDDDVVVLCGNIGNHRMNACSKRDFEAEKKTAVKLLNRMASLPKARS